MEFCASQSVMHGKILPLRFSTRRRDKPVFKVWFVSKVIFFLFCLRYDTSEIPNVQQIRENCKVASNLC